MTQVNDAQIYEKLERIERMLAEQNLLQKEVLTTTESAEYLDISESQLYKLTSAEAIPYYKPGGKKLYFRRSELDAWIFRHRRTTRSEIAAKADMYLKNKSLKNKI